MAVVHRAESPQRGVVALKRLHDHDAFELDFDIVRSFVEEARLAIRMRHRNIARTHTLGKVAGRYFLEMEYVPGPTLHACAMRGPMPIEVVVGILVQLCDALEYVHDLRDDRGRPLELVHRDVSLSNAIVSDGVVKLIDFGIVKGHSTCAPTQAGTIKGKLAYVAPEYLAGQLDRRADLYALGVIAHELLTDRRLFLTGDASETIARIQTLRVPPPSRFRGDIPPALDAIVLRALARDPDARWQSAGHLRAALAELCPATPAAIAAWVTWAFAREEQPPTSQLLRVIDTLDAVEPKPWPFEAKPWMLVATLALFAFVVAMIALRV